MCGKVLHVAIQITSIRILTTFLSEKEIGYYYLIVSILSFFNLVILNPPCMYYGRRILCWKDSGNLLNATYLLGIIITILASISALVLFVFVYYQDYRFPYEPIHLIFFLFLSFSVSAIHRNMLHGLNSLGYQKRFVLILIFSLAIGLLFSSLFVYFICNNALFWLYGLIVGELLTIYFIINKYISISKLDKSLLFNSINFSILNRVFTFCIPIAVTTFLMWMQNYSYRYIIEKKYSIEVLAQIGVGLSISASIFSAVESVSMQYFNPKFLKNIQYGDAYSRSEAWNNIARYMIPIYVLIALIVIFLSKYIVILLVDQKFHDCFHYTMIGVGIEFCRVITNLLSKVSQSEYKTSYTILPYFFGSLICVISLSYIEFNNYYFIPITIFIASLTTMVFMYFNMKKILNLKLSLGA